MIDYSQILLRNYPNTQWIMSGGSYDDLDWHDESTKPTKEELDALWETTQEQIAAEAQAKIDNKQSALSKLMSLGLTEEEALALGVK